MENFIKEFNGFIIGLGGLLIAGLSLYLSYKERTKNLRESLYNKQIEIINILSEDLINFNKKFDLLFNGNWDDFKEFYNNFSEKYKLYSIFLPNEINKSINKFIETINMILDPKFMYDDYFKRLVKEEFHKIITPYYEIFDSFRNYLGIEKLSAETKKLLSENTKK